MMGIYTETDTDMCFWTHIVRRRLPAAAPQTSAANSFPAPTRCLSDTGIVEGRRARYYLRR